METINHSGIQPVEFFVVVELDPVKEKTAGGIFLPEQTQAADKMSTQEGALVAVSPHAFDYANDWPEGSKPQIGQRVVFKRHEGWLRDHEGRTFRVMNDKSIVGTVPPPAAALSAVA